MKQPKYITSLFLLLLAATNTCHVSITQKLNRAFESKITILLKPMTVEEKVGQMAQVAIDQGGTANYANKTFYIDQNKLNDVVEPADTITLLVYTSKNAVFNLYEDEGTNYDYEKGSFSNISFTYNDANNQLTIGDRKGKFNGMLTNRIFKIVRINKNNTQAFDVEKKADAKGSLYFLDHQCMIRKRNIEGGNIKTSNE